MSLEALVMSKKTWYVNILEIKTFHLWKKNKELLIVFFYLATLFNNQQNSPKNLAGGFHSSK